MALEVLSYKVDSDVVHQELPDRQSRDEVTIKTGAATVMEIGTVIAALTADSKFVLLAPAAATGAEVAAAVLLERVDATAADQQAVVLCRVATVVSQALIWPAGITAPQKAAAIVQLNAHEIVVRNGV